MDKKFFVPFETALLLKEKGYNGICDYYYAPDKQLYFGVTRVSNDTLDYENNGTVAAPTYHEVVDWLEGKGIYVSAFLCIGETNKEDTYKIWWKSFIDIPPYEEQSSAVCSTREEALNESILKALEIL